MDRYVTGASIRRLREAKGYTQAALAELMCVSDKTVSKWENGRGYPDITLLQPLASCLGVSMAELMNGESITNANRSANMLRSQFYVCPICGNILHAAGEAVISCCGITLPPLHAEQPDAEHQFLVEQVEDEWFVTVQHPMTKEHAITFLAAVADDRVTVVRLYPEQNAQARLPRRSVRDLYAFCNHDGLFHIRLPLRGNRRVREE